MSERLDLIPAGTFSRILTVQYFLGSGYYFAVYSGDNLIKLCRNIASDIEHAQKGSRAIVFIYRNALLLGNIYDFFGSGAVTRRDYNRSEILVGVVLQSGGSAAD